MTEDINTVTLDEMVEAAARAIERNRHPEWTDDQFEIWWTKDPLFVSVTRTWHYFQGTEKQRILHEARIALTAVHAMTTPPHTGGYGTEIPRLLIKDYAVPSDVVRVARERFEISLVEAQQQLTLAGVHPQVLRPLSQMLAAMADMAEAGGRSRK